MKRPSSTQLLQLFLILALIVNAIIHFTSPSYRFYKENVDRLDRVFHDFERQVKIDFVPAIISVASNNTYRATETNFSNSVSNSTSSSEFPSSGTLFNLDYHYFTAGNKSGFHFDGHDYFNGDSFFGSSIRVITPTVIVTDSYHFVKPFLRKFSLEGDKSPSSYPAAISPSNSNSSIVVPMSPDVYAPLEY